MFQYNICQYLCVQEFQWSISPTTASPWVVLPAPWASPTQLAAAWLLLFWTRSDFWINLRSNPKPNPARKTISKQDIVLDLGRSIISLQIEVPATNVSGWRPSVGTADGLAVQKSGLTTTIWLNTSHVQQRERSNLNAQYLNWRCIVARPHFLIISLGQKTAVTPRSFIRCACNLERFTSTGYFKRRMMAGTLTKTRSLG